MNIDYIDWFLISIFIDLVSIFIDLLSIVIDIKGAEKIVPVYNTRSNKAEFDTLQEQNGYYRLVINRID